VPARSVASVLFLCTGNATRSVIAGCALRRRRPDLLVATAGTLTVDGLPISWRTRAALDDVGLTWPRHASRQVDRVTLDEADLVVGLAPEHIEWVRREHAAVGPRAGTLIRLAERLAGPGSAPLAERVAALQLGMVTLEPREEVVDPGGGEVESYVACARQVVALVDRLAARL
jgi:protein-tyrosine-phosphatase